MRHAIRAAAFSLAAALGISAPLFAQNDLDQRINKEADSMLAVSLPMFFRLTQVNAGIRSFTFGTFDSRRQTFAVICSTQLLL
jgi:hypothetical protein